MVRETGGGVGDLRRHRDSSLRSEWRSSFLSADLGGTAVPPLRLALAGMARGTLQRRRQEKPPGDGGRNFGPR